MNFKRTDLYDPAESPLIVQVHWFNIGNSFSPAIICHLNCTPAMNDKIMQLTK